MLKKIQLPINHEQFIKDLNDNFEEVAGGKVYDFMEKDMGNAEPEGSAEKIKDFALGAKTYLAWEYVETTSSVTLKDYPPMLNINFIFSSNNETIIQILDTKEKNIKITAYVGDFTDCRILFRPTGDVNINGSQNDFIIKLHHSGYIGDLIWETDGTYRVCDCIEEAIPLPHSLTVKDDVKSISDVNVIDFKGARVDSDQNNPNKAIVNALTAYNNFGSSGGAEGNIVNLMEPLQVYSDPDLDDAVRIEIKRGVFQKALPVGFLGTMLYHEDITTNRDVKLWFDKTLIDSNGFITFNRAKKSFNLQEIDGLDPNVTGGQGVLLVCEVKARGTASVDTDLKMYLYNESEDAVAKDSKGNFISFGQSYKAGESFKPIAIETLLVVKGTENYSIRFKATAPNSNDLIELEDYYDGNSYFLIQYLSSSYEGGFPQSKYFELTMHSIRTLSKYMGVDFKTLEAALSEDKTETTLQAWEGLTSITGVHLSNATDINVEIANSILNVNSTGTDLSLFNVGLILNSEEVLDLKNKQVKIDLNFSSSSTAFNLIMYKWLGDIDKFTDKIILDEQNYNYNLEQNWVEIERKEYTLDLINKGLYTTSYEFTMPNDAKNVAIVLVPIEKENPLSLNLAKMNISASNPFNAYEIIDSKRFEEKQLELKDEVTTFTYALPKGLYSVRYTFHAGETKIPVGLANKSTDVINDNAWNDNTGLSNYEGDLKFNNNASISIKGYINAFAGENLGVGETATFKMYFYNVDKKEKVLASEKAFSLKHGDSNVRIPLKEFKFNVSKDDSLRLIVENVNENLGYIQANSKSTNMIYINVTTEEIV